ncbi:anti-sigma factor family protein [Amycolatopsis palatopharyngis]|uniref:anti-sigma factor family protein n=1 Tax=Amycolatopsis palatopharyngis TaxID=187982 RepID=UPI000E24E100|nr:zf-HC2 domain-containing protein [Amycolatopsis palatopharyngis]
MSERNHRALRESLGAYVLDQLDPAERLAVEAHLDGCTDCRAELAELAPLATQLRTVDPDRLDSLPQPPAELREQVLERIRAEPPARRSRPRWTVPAAAAAVALLLGGLAGYVLAPDPPFVPTEDVRVVTSAPGLQVQAQVVPHTWGVEVKLIGTGFESGSRYEVVVLDESGTPQDAGEFVGVGAQEMRCNLNSAVLRADATGLQVRDAADRTVLAAEF